jgi:hypothetical protein
MARFSLHTLEYSTLKIVNDMDKKRIISAIPPESPVPLTEIDKKIQAAENDLLAAVRSRGQRVVAVTMIVDRNSPDVTEPRTVVVRPGEHMWRWKPIGGGRPEICMRTNGTELTLVVISLKKGLMWLDSPIRYPRIPIPEAQDDYLDFLKIALAAIT